MCFERKRLHYFCQRTNNIQVLYFVTMLPKKEKKQNHVNFLDLLWSRIGRFENKKLIVLIDYLLSKQETTFLNQRNFARGEKATRTISVCYLLSLLGLTNNLL